MYVFTGAAWNANAVAMRILSVCPSVKRVDCDKTKERSVQIVTPYERSFSLIFSEEERLVGGPLLPVIFGQPAPVAAKSPISIDIRS